MSKYLLGSGFALLVLVFAIMNNHSASQVQAVYHAPHAQAVSRVSLGTRGYYMNMAIQDAQAVGLSPTIFVKQITEESNFNPRAISPAGAIGIAQFMPTTADGLNLNPYDPVASLLAAAKMMRTYVTSYGNYAMALAAYNAGPGGVQQALRCGTAWISCLPTETRNYIAIILS